MTNPKELYKLLSADFKAERRCYFASRGEGMLQGLEKDTHRVFLVNTNTREAWEITSINGYFSYWDKTAIDMAAVSDLPAEAQRNVMEMRSPFHLSINEFKDGVASVSWTLQPDGRYYADDDGFGMENDEEIILKAYIDKLANIVKPFQKC